jgi:hypothetical protein
MKNIKKEKRGFFAFVPLWALILFGVGGIAFIVELISKRSIALSDFITNTTGKFFRALLSYSTYIFPFSVAEMLLWFSPVILGCIIALAVKCACRSWRSLSRFVAGVLAICVSVYSLFVFTMGTAYYGTGFVGKMGLERKTISEEELYYAASLIAERAAELCDEVMYPEGTYSSMPYTFSEMSKKINEAYDAVCEKYDGIDDIETKAKPVILSPLWTYTHISGVYSFFTGEANVNTNYPDFIIASSAAHEMAHQRGIVTEDEANFVAFLVCIESDDPYIRYAGYMDMLNTFMMELSSSSELYGKLYWSMPERMREEFVSYSVFFDKYRENVAADVSTAVNDAYIENHNQPAGVKTYGLVVELVTAYLNETN